MNYKSAHNLAGAGDGKKRAAPEQPVNRIMSITKDDDYPQAPSKQSQVKEYEKQIDQMVYELYGLTEEEIKIVEGAKK